MISCVVYGCTNNSITSDSSIKYHRFPKNELAQQWVTACGWENNTLDLDTAHICSIHFEESAYDSGIKIVDYVARYCKILREDATPTLYLPQAQIIIKEGPLDLEESVVVYTINDSNDGIKTISLEDDSGEKHIFELQPSTSGVKLETIELRQEPLKNEISEDDVDYNGTSYPDLGLVQAHNTHLKRKIADIEEELDKLQTNLEEVDEEYNRYESEYRILDRKITKKSLPTSQQEQKALLSKVFSEAQIKILFGKKRVRWTNDDMAVGYIIRHLSNRRCYSYLTKKLNIPLPGVSSIKRWVTTKKMKKIRN